MQMVIFYGGANFHSMFTEWNTMEPMLLYWRAQPSSYSICLLVNYWVRAEPLQVVSVMLFVVQVADGYCLIVEITFTFSIAVDVAFADCDQVLFRKWWGGLIEKSCWLKMTMVVYEP
jgi:hypothetical protein